MAEIRIDSELGRRISNQPSWRTAYLHHPSVERYDYQKAYKDFWQQRLQTIRQLHQVSVLKDDLFVKMCQDQLLIPPFSLSSAKMGRSWVAA